MQKSRIKKAIKNPLVLTTAGLAAAVAIKVVYFPPPQGAHAGDDTDYRQFKGRTVVELPGTWRNFTAKNLPGGHPDFGLGGADGPGRYVDIMGNTLDTARGLTQFGGTGHFLTDEWRDGRGRAILSPRSYIAPRSGDTSGSANSSAGGAVTSAATVDQWFRDLPGVNTSREALLRMNWYPASREYVFAGSFDSMSGTPDYNYTYMVDPTFVYEAGKGQYFTVGTSGEAWVYINDQLVIDRGGGLGKGSGAPIVVDDTIRLSNISSASAEGGIGPAISTNSILPGAVTSLQSSGIQGDVLVGPGGNPVLGIITDKPSAITGTRGTLAEAMPVALVSVPSDLPASQGDQVFDGKTVLWTDDAAYGDLKLLNKSIFTVRGDVRVLVNKTFNIEQQSEIRLEPGSRLRMYVMGDVIIRNYVDINKISGDPDALLIACMGVGKRILVDQNTEVFGHLVCEDGAIELGNSTIVVGTLTSQSAELFNSARFTGGGSRGAVLGGSGSSSDAYQRFDVDRFAGLADGQVCRLKCFFTNRTNFASRTNIRTNIDSLWVVRGVGKGPDHD